MRTYLIVGILSVATLGCGPNETPEETPMEALATIQQHVARKEWGDVYDRLSQETQADAAYKWKKDKPLWLKICAPEHRAILENGTQRDVFIYTHRLPDADTYTFVYDSPKLLSVKDDQAVISYRRSDMEVKLAMRRERGKWKIHVMDRR